MTETMQRLRTRLDAMAGTAARLDPEEVDRIFSEAIAAEMAAAEKRAVASDAQQPAPMGDPVAFIQ